MRTDGRKQNELRSIRITTDFLSYAEGSVLVEYGDTKIICSATVDPQLPKWLQGSGQGWVTAEYGMLPRSTQSRIRRDKALNSGRTQEISRLIGRSLRAAVDLKKLGERQIIVDCDVIQADGGTRTAAVTGGFVALALASKRLLDVQEITQMPIRHYVAAVSVGIKSGEPLLDLNYIEDSTIETDMNFVMTDKGHLVEIQGTAEGAPFAPSELNSMLEVATKGCRELFTIQSRSVGEFLPLNLK